jgi:subtilase family serine protease
MRISGSALSVCVTAAILAACGVTQPPIAAPGAMPQTRIRNVVPQWQAQHLAHAACPQVVGKPSCLALISNKNGISPLSGCNPSSTCGWTATQLEKAYNLTGSLGKGSGQIVAVIEAGDDPDAATTFSTYRTQYGLGTGTMLKYNQNGQESNYPPSCEDYGWCVETDLDIEMIAAACPKCTVYIMEAGSSISDFEIAEKEAVTLGATILSNSWICYGAWDCGDSHFPNYFDTPNITYLAATGDDAYDNIGGPSVLASVIAVGGTQLAVSGSKYSETIWNDAGGGCATPSVVGSPGVPKPKWQYNKDCKYRSDADVSSEAGCSPAVAEYSELYGGWFGVCGTSVASPFNAGIFALAGNATSQDGGETFWKPKKHHKHLHDVCGSCLFSTYSYPGGWGTPNGIKAY